MAMKQELEGYTEEERAMIEKAHSFSKMADDLRAQAEQSRYKREHGDKAKPTDS